MSVLRESISEWKEGHRGRGLGWSTSLWHCADRGCCDWSWQRGDGAVAWNPPNSVSWMCFLRLSADRGGTEESLGPSEMHSKCLLLCSRQHQAWVTRHFLFLYQWTLWSLWSVFDYKDETQPSLILSIHSKRLRNKCKYMKKGTFNVFTDNRLIISTEGPSWVLDSLQKYPLVIRIRRGWCMAASPSLNSYPL